VKRSHDVRVENRIACVLMASRPLCFRTFRNELIGSEIIIYGVIQHARHILVGGKISTSCRRRLSCSGADIAWRHDGPGGVAKPG
jgi:hypothetical protein